MINITNPQADSHVGNTKCELKPNCIPHLVIMICFTLKNKVKFLKAVQCLSRIYRSTEQTVHNQAKKLQEDKEKVLHNSALLSETQGKSTWAIRTLSLSRVWRSRIKISNLPNDPQTQRLR